ncbi:unnamed protein product [Polarella glacialis]|uniref:Uncharacterized protein n=1 Tax=Polarella glacialis TaxID=89957 RepID=A0A813KA25_POLGL|nr:unnamed protein product [Polarella glacialis]
MYARALARMLRPSRSLRNSPLRQLAPSIQAQKLSSRWAGSHALRQETYRWVDKAKSGAKEESNTRLAQLAELVAVGRRVWEPRLPRQREPQAHSLWALVLDAPSLGSSSALRQHAGFKPSRIVVPNDSDANFGAFGRGQGAGVGAVVLGGTSLHTFLVETRAAALAAKDSRAEGLRGPFACVFCDFTQCLDGSWKASQELEAPGGSLDGWEACRGTGLA